MGLDMYLSARLYIGSYGTESKAQMAVLEPVLKELPGITLPYRHADANNSIQVELPVMYWRKANHIHAWFVEHIQDGKDECQYSYVDIDKLRELHDLCSKVFMAKTPAFAAEHLPCADGFFFGGSEYDEWYFESTRCTMEALEHLLAQYDAGQLKGWDIYYHASW